jgi:hypothetical protein
MVWVVVTKADGITLKCSKRDLAVPGRTENRSFIWFFFFLTRLYLLTYIRIHECACVMAKRDDENNVFRWYNIHTYIYIYYIRVCVCDTATVDCVNKMKFSLTRFSRNPEYHPSVLSRYRLVARVIKT